MPFLYIYREERKSDRQEFLPKALSVLLANALPITLRPDGACIKLQQQLCFLSLLATDPTHTKHIPTSLLKAIYVVLLKFPTVFNKMVDGVCAPTSQPRELKKPRPNNPRPPGPTPPSPSPTNIPDNSSGDVSGATTTTATSGTNDDVNAQHSHHDDILHDTVPALLPTTSHNHNTHSPSPSSLRSLQCFSTLKSGFKRLFFCIPSAERHR
ncbi:hypothetical protein BJV82DRAFT_89289 [Fennellomyces sp. T-0311]|nr:hypothetical protein BJV82DRAFT_89289 [Fennellomyces sp. T-0311]